MVILPRVLHLFDRTSLLPVSNSILGITFMSPKSLAWRVFRSITKQSWLYQKRTRLLEAQKEWYKRCHLRQIWHFTQDSLYKRDDFGCIGLGFQMDQSKASGSGTVSEGKILIKQLAYYQLNQLCWASYSLVQPSSIRMLWSSHIFLKPERQRLSASPPPARLRLSLPHR